MFMQKITAAQFCDAFVSEWSVSVAGCQDGFPAEWHDKKQWTQYMLRHEGFFHRIMRRLTDGSLWYHPEFFRIDAALYSGEHAFGESSSIEPCHLYVLVEHEHGDDVNNEARRMLCLNCPLKVLIMYDYTQDSKDADRSLERWVPDRLQTISKMLIRSNSRFSENPDTEYLVLIASRIESKHCVRWRSATLL